MWHREFAADRPLGGSCQGHKPLDLAGIDRAELMLAVLDDFGEDAISDWSFTAMDRAVLERRLQRAEACVSEGERFIARQRGLVAELEQQGDDTFRARVLLAELEHLHKLHLDHLDLIRRELAYDRPKGIDFPIAAIVHDVDRRRRDSNNTAAPTRDVQDDPTT